MMAAADMFEITIRGVGGHAAIPQTAKDPVVIAAQLVGALQTLVSRNANPMDAAVLSITQIHTGSTHNVIPDEAYLNGTVRTFRAEVQEMMIAGMRRIVDGIAAAFGVSISLDYQYGYPATLNHAEQAESRRWPPAKVVRRRQCPARRRAVAGRRGLRLSAERAAGRLPVPRPGRRGIGRDDPQSALTTSTTRSCPSAPRCWRPWSRTS